MQNWRSDIETAMSKGDISTLRRLAGTHRATLNEVVDGYSVLYWAAQYQNATALQILLDAGAEPDPPVAKTGSRGSALFMAAKTGAIECCEALLARGARVDYRNSRAETPLMYAAGNARDNYNMITLLARHGACLDACPDDGTEGARQSKSLPALHIAAFHHRNENFRALIDLGANPDLAFLGETAEDLFLASPFIDADTRLESFVGLYFRARRASHELAGALGGQRGATPAL